MNEKKRKKGISLCAIVRNESENIKRMLDSVKKFADEMIVVDTGSIDDTVNIAKECGALILHYEWENDFSAARNYSIRHASYEWILVLDADEVIAERDGVKLRNFIKEDRGDAAVLAQRNYCDDPNAEMWQVNDNSYEEAKGYSGYFDVPVIRLFRNRDDIYFEGVVHEVVDKSLGKRKKRYPDIVIHHYGAVASDEERSEKGKFYLFLLLKQLEKNPEDSTTWFLIGRQYYTLGKDAEAITFLSKVVADGTRCEMAYDNLANSYIRAGMFEEAKRVLLKLKELNPKYYEAYSPLGIAFYETGEKEKGINILKEAISSGYATFKPCFNLAAICYKEKRFEDALKYVNLAIGKAPHIDRAHYLKFFVAESLGLKDEALKSADKLKVLNKGLYSNIENRLGNLK